MLFISLPDQPAGTYSQRTKIGEVDYLLRFSHNSRTDSWTLDLSTFGADGDGDPIVTGRKLFSYPNLLRNAMHPQAPAGRLFVIPLDGSRKPPTAGDFDNRIRLVYLGPDEHFDEAPID